MEKPIYEIVQDYYYTMETDGDAELLLQFYSLVQKYIEVKYERLLSN